MFMYLTSALAVLGCTHLSYGTFRNGDDLYTLTIRMPNVTAERTDTLVCTSKRLDPRETYIVKFTPHASKDIAHHMMVYGCLMPASQSPSWICDKAESPNVPVYNAVCKEVSRQIIFAWALDASEKSLPDGVGLRVSGNTGIHYLVIQLHYAKEFPHGVTDNSGYTFELTHKSYLLDIVFNICHCLQQTTTASWIHCTSQLGIIPPHQTDFYMDLACEYPLNYTVYPFAYRTHSHKLGVVTSGYRVRGRNYLEIGRMSPQLPQAFYDVSHPGMNIGPGDMLASRCVMNSMSRDNDTMIGYRNNDEMCNFYIMYSTYEQDNLENVMCFQESSSVALLDKIPLNSGSLNGIPGAEKVIKKFDMA